MFTILKSYTNDLKTNWARNEVARKEREQEENLKKGIRKIKDNELSNFNLLLDEVQRWELAKPQIKTTATTICLLPHDKNPLPFLAFDFQ